MPTNNTSFLVAVCAVAIIAPPIALADDDYVKRSGEDQYGPAYEKVETVPDEVREVLDEDGTFVVPSFIDRTIWIGDVEHWVIDQSPAAGTIKSCEQSLEVQLEYTNALGNTGWTRLPVDLIDLTPPEIVVNLVSGDDPQVSFGGVLRYPIGAVVTPIVDVIESCGVHQELTLNGEPYMYGTPVLDEGLYILTVSVEDDAGNHAANTSYFEIRERPSHTGVAVVRDTLCEIDPGGETGFFSTTVLVASDSFDHESILRSSPVLVLQDADGGFLPHQPATVSDVQINDCWLELTFDAELTSPDGVSCPSFINVFGVGLANDQIAYEWGARAANVSESNPEDMLLDLVNGPGSCQALREPDPEPVIPCRAIEDFWPAIGTCAAPFAPGGASCDVPPSGTSSAVSATTGVAGNALAHAQSATWPPFSTCGGLATTCPLVTGGGIIVTSFAGDCCTCSVVYVASARVTATVLASRGPAVGPLFTTSVAASGDVTFVPPCGLITTGPTTATFTYGNITPTGTPPANPLTVTSPPAAVNCTVTACVPSVMTIDTSALVSAIATAQSAAVLNSWCIGQARLTSVIGMIQATPTFTTCPPEAN